jgi:hypothetical protein
MALIGMQLRDFVESLTHAALKLVSKKPFLMQARVQRVREIVQRYKASALTTSSLALCQANILLECLNGKRAGSMI